MALALFFFLIILVISISFICELLLKHHKTQYSVIHVWLLTFGLPRLSVRLAGGNDLLEKVGDKLQIPSKSDLVY